MNSVFLDASVLFAAAYSNTGASRELFRLFREEELALFTNEFAVEETKRNLQNKAPEGFLLLQALLHNLPITILAAPSKESVLEAAQYTKLKDAPIIAGAIAAKVVYLATFDRKHLIDPPEVAARSGLIIATPGDIINQLQRPL